MKTRITLAALPPSVNHIYRHTCTGVYRTAAYNAWANGEILRLKRQMENQLRWSTPVYVTAALKRPRSNADLDNRLKGIADLMQSLGIISDDKLIHGWNCYWTESLPTGIAAEISITAADPFGVEAA